VTNVIGIHNISSKMQTSEKVAHTAFHDWNFELGCKLEELDVLNAQGIYI